MTAVTTALLLFAGVGAALAAFLAAGWASFRDGKLPDPGMLFRAAIAGVITGGAGAFWYTAGGGDSAVERAAAAVRDAAASLSEAATAVQSGGAAAADTAADTSLLLREGFPGF